MLLVFYKSVWFIVLITLHDDPATHGINIVISLRGGI